jgi:hypothetical protein
MCLEHLVHDKAVDSGSDMHIILVYFHINLIFSTKATPEFHYRVFYFTTREMRIDSQEMLKVP